MKQLITIGVLALLPLLVVWGCTENVGDPVGGEGRTYTIVDTGVKWCYSDSAQLRTPPRPGEAFYGQDAFYQGPQPRYRDNGDGTISDLNTGLMWQKTPNLRRKSTIHAVDIEWIAESRLDIDAAKIAAIASPAMPTGSRARMNAGRTSSPFETEKSAP